MGSASLRGAPSKVFSPGMCLFGQHANLNIVPFQEDAWWTQICLEGDMLQVIGDTWEAYPELKLKALHRIHQYAVGLAHPSSPRQ